MPKMVATKKQKYGRQNISVGDIFTVKDKDVRLLRALRMVTDMPAVKAMTAENTSALIPNPSREHATTQHVEHVSTMSLEPTTEELPESSTSKEEVVEEVVKLEDDSEQSQEYSQMLRDRARSLGIHVDGRWSDARVQREIDDHNKKTYQHMDMRATE